MCRFRRLAIVASWEAILGEQLFAFLEFLSSKLHQWLAVLVSKPLFGRDMASCMLQLARTH